MNRLLLPIRLSFLLLVVLTACDTTDPQPPEEKPPGYQEDIPWPSLADSPWPMYRADPQNTGRAKLHVLNSKLSITKVIDSGNLLAGVSLGISSLYFNNSNPSYLISYDLGSLMENWNEIIGVETLVSPLITSKHILTTSQNTVYAFDENGDSLWSFKVNEKYVYQRSFNIDKDGYIYIISNKTLYKIDEEGNIIDKLSDESFHLFNTSAFSPDGLTLYLQGSDVSLVAVDITTFSVKWKYGTSQLTIPPIVDSYGNIYVLPWAVNSQYNLYSINSDGKLNWKFQHSEKMDAATACTPVIGKYGDIYFGLDSIISVSYEGNLNWKIDVTSDMRAGANSDISSLTADAMDNIFLGTFDNHLIVISKEGNIISDIKLTDDGKGLLPIVISSNAVFAPIYKGKNIYILN